MNHFRFLILPLLAGLSFSGLWFTTCLAMDPRFEIDPTQIQKNTGSTSGRENVTRRSVSLRSKSVRRSPTTRHKKATVHEHPSVALHLAAVGSGSAASELFLHQRVRTFWDTVAPSGGSEPKPLIFKTDVFDLSIDSSRYPLLKAVDGGKVLLDTGATLPPLVRSLIQEKDQMVRIVNVSPADSRRFLGALLAAGGFYSVEEQPVMTFGQDPQLKVHSDFKVERTAESVMRNEVMLVSSSRQRLPLRLMDFMKKQGFELLEPFAEESSVSVPLRHRVVRTSSQDHGQAVDLVLDALAVPVERNRRVELFNTVESGIELSVAAERYFERGGKRYVVARFTGDPVAYTLFRLLETKGYRVVILEQRDNFKMVASKLLSRMDLPSSYASHLLLADQGGRYSFEMSGFLLENSISGGGAVMLTDRPIERSMQELLYDHGYQVQER